MSETLTTSAPRAAGTGPGRLVLVVGPSGAGKDTLLDLAKIACAADRNIVFPRRLVTREASQSEDNEYLSADAFVQALTRGDLAMHWEAHGHRYGLPRTMDDDIRSGRTAVVNVSRTVVGEMRRAYADVFVVSITAPSDVLAERLAMRARRSDGRLEHRLQRSIPDGSMPDATIVNVGSPECHARRLVRIIRGKQPEE